MLIITARKRSLGQGNIFASVCHSVHRGSASVHAGIHPPPPPRRPPTQGDPPPGPHPGGKLRGIRSRPTPKGEIEGDQIQAHTQGGNSRGSDPGPHPRGKFRGIRQVLANIQVGNSGGSGAEPPPPDDYCCRRYTSYWNAFLLVELATQAGYDENSLPWL